MLPRNELILRGVCYAAGALLLFQAVSLVARINPLHKIKIPDLPVLTNTTETAATRSNKVSSAGSGSTNAVAGTNVVATNSATTGKGSNVVSSKTNITAPAQGTSDTAIASNQTNRVQKARTEPEKPGATGLVSTISKSNAAASSGLAGTNTGRPQLVTNTNVAIQAQNTNPPPDAASPRLAGRPPGFPVPGMPGGPGMALAELPKETRAKLERIIDSELLGPVMRPMPMALLGIAGEHVFLRGPNGQTGMIKTGETLGAVKLLKIGINRVLVEEDGQSKELTIFGGMGGESLMSSSKTNSP